MTKAQRAVAIALSGVLSLAGFVFGRVTRTESTTAAPAASETRLATNGTPVNFATGTTQESQTFYLSDYKTGYAEGYNSSATGQGAGIAYTARPGYNDGFKQGFADAYQAQVSPQAAQFSAAPVAAAPVAQRVVYRTARGSRRSYASRPVYYERKRSSKLKTALTIAAPAAIGAGVGALVGGKKGAGVGALFGGGGGALYHLFKNRD